MRSRCWAARSAASPAEIVYGDDQFKPDVGRQVAEEMLKKDQVDFMTGFIWSNVLLAAYQPIIKSGTILIGANAGPHELAGEMCAPNFFSDLLAERRDARGDGPVHDRAGTCTDVYIMAPDYAAGKDMLAGFKRYFKGKHRRTRSTPSLGQSDYQAEISQIRAANPKARDGLLSGRHGHPVHQAIRAVRIARDRSRSIRCSRSTRPSLPGHRRRGRRQLRDGLLVARPQEPAQPGNSSPPSARSTTTCPPSMRRESFDAIDADRQRGEGGQGRPRRQERACSRHATRPTSLRCAATSRYNTNHFPIENFYLLQDRQGRGREPRPQDPERRSSPTTRTPTTRSARCSEAACRAHSRKFERHSLPSPSSGVVVALIPPRLGEGRGGV